MPINVIELNGKEVIFADFSNMSDQDELINDGKKATKMIIDRNEINTRFLVDFSNALVGRKFMSQIKNDGKYVLKRIPLITAVTGITGLKKLMIKGYIRFTGSQLRVFDTLDQAKAYLVDR